MNSGLFDEGVPHKPGERQTDGCDCQVVLERPDREIHILDFAALSQKLANLRLGLTKICEPGVERFRIRQVRHLFRFDYSEVFAKASHVRREIRARAVRKNIFQEPSN